MKWIYGVAGIASLIVGLAAVVAPSAAQSPASGAQTFAMCKGCHTLEKGGRNGIGPNLHDLTRAITSNASAFIGFSPIYQNDRGHRQGS